MVVVDVVVVVVEQSGLNGSGQDVSARLVVADSATTSRNAGTSIISKQTKDFGVGQQATKAKSECKVMCAPV